MQIETQELDIPIPSYPPFKLRSSLIDNDPVIWVHLLESYLGLFEKLIVMTNTGEFKLNSRSQLLLSAFLKVFLNETAEETHRIFSLGAINPDILRNTHLLKVRVFQYIHTQNFVNLQLSGSSVWDFVRVYGPLAHANRKKDHSIMDLATVRRLVQGVVPSKRNNKSNDVSLIKSLQNHLVALVQERKFHRTDLDVLALLLGQSGSGKKSKANVSVNKSKHVPGKSMADFTEAFVNEHWLRSLENLSQAKDVEKTCFQIILISIMSLPALKVSNLFTQANIYDFPTTMKILLSGVYTELHPVIVEKLPFLFENSERRPDPESVATLKSLFPDIADERAADLLTQYDNNVEKLTNDLFDNPSLLESPAKSEEPIRKSAFDDDEISNLDFRNTDVIVGKKKRNDINEQSTESRNSNLVHAMRMLYESDEDEPDDTYDEYEKTTYDGEAAPRDDTDEPNQVEQTLFNLFRKAPAQLAQKARGTKSRQELKKATSWSDEQIEGWAKMLDRSPKRFKLLEEKYMFDLGNRAPLKPKPEPKADTNGKPQTKESVKRQQKRKEANKGKSANHNRKGGHDKKMSKVL